MNIVEAADGENEEKKGEGESDNCKIMMFSHDRMVILLLKNYRHRIFRSSERKDEKECRRLILLLSWGSVHDTFCRLSMDHSDDCHENGNDDYSK